MALPPYASTAQRVWYWTFRAICVAILLFLILPILVIIPLSFNATDFFTFTPGMIALDPDAYSLRHYENFLTTADWRTAFRNSFTIAPAATHPDLPPRTFLEALARAACHYGLSREETALLGLYTWIEQHTTALARLLPLGPIASQRVVDALLTLVPTAVARALAIQNDDIGFGCPTLSLLSAWHETQYTRVFRS